MRLKKKHKKKTFFELFDDVLSLFLEKVKETLNSDIYPKNLVEIDGELVEYD